jgi:tetratricopeptide (TPR) repeat protein
MKRTESPARTATPSSAGAPTSSPWLRYALVVLALLTSLAVLLIALRPPAALGPRPAGDGRLAQERTLPVAPGGAAQRGDGRSADALATRPGQTPGTALAPQSPAPSLQPSITLPKEHPVIDTAAEQQRLLETVESAVRQYPDDAATLHIAGLVYAELLQAEKAVEYFERSLDVQDRNPDVVVAYTNVLVQLGRHEPAIETLENAVARGVSSAPLLAALGDAYTQQGEIEKAVETLMRAAVRYANEPLIRLRLAQAELQMGRFESAEENARAAIELGLRDRAAYLALSTSLLRQGKRDEALEVRKQEPPVESQETVDDDKYRESFREFASHHYGLLANVERGHDEQQRAEKLLLDSLKLNPAAIPSLLSLGDLYQKEERIEDAVYVYQRLLEVEPGSPMNYTNLASLAVRKGDLTLAEQTLRRAVEVDASGNAHLFLAQFLLGTGNAAEAIPLAEAGAKRLETTDAYIIWITALQAAGQEVAALRVLSEAQSKNPTDPRWRSPRF